MIVKSRMQREPSDGDSQQETTSKSKAAAKAQATDRSWQDHDAATGRRRRFWLLLVLGLLIAGGFGAYSQFGDRVAGPTQPLIYQTVQRGDLPITVIERGNLESQEDLEIICEVDDVSGDGIVGTQLIWIIPNGSSVQEGDLLAELDVAPHLERRDRQMLDTEQAKAIQIQAQVKFDNQQTQNETALADAELEVKLSELELEMFQDPERGTHQLDVAAIEREIEDVHNEILAAEASLALQKKESDGIATLFKLGYAGKRQLDQSRLEYLQAESQVAAKMNKLDTQNATLEKKTSYERQMQLLKLEGAQETAKRQLEQVKRNNEADLAQAKAALDAANEKLKKEEELLQRYTEQVEKCKIYAPQEGMVAYAVSNSRYSSEEIREGAHVRPRQKILSLPNLKQMQVQTSVHESVLDYIKTGLPATITVDAFPDKTFRGSVASVAVLPDSGGWYGSDTKVYKTIVTIDEEVQQLKPGMTAVAEIHVDRLEDIVFVPVQAVIQVQDRTYCFVKVDGRPEQRIVDLGRTNDKFVEIRSGLSEGEEVVLNPMALMDEIDEPEEESGVESEEESEEESEASEWELDSESIVPSASDEGGPTANASETRPRAAGKPQPNRERNADGGRPKQAG